MCLMYMHGAGEIKNDHTNPTITFFSTSLLHITDLRARTLIIWAQNNNSPLKLGLL